MVLEVGCKRIDARPVQLRAPVLSHNTSAPGQADAPAAKHGRRHISDGTVHKPAPLLDGKEE